MYIYSHSLTFCIITTLLMVTVTLRVLIIQYSTSGLGDDVTACALGRTPSVRVHKPQYNVAMYHILATSN